MSTGVKIGDFLRWKVLVVAGHATPVSGRAVPEVTEWRWAWYSGSTWRGKEGKGMRAASELLPECTAGRLYSQFWGCATPQAVMRA